MHDPLQRAMLAELGLGWARLLPPAGAAVPARPAEAGPPPQDHPGPAGGARHPADAATPAPRLHAEARGADVPATPAAPRPGREPADATVSPDPARGPAPQAEELAALGWEGLAARVAGCRACGLCEGRRQAVLDAGPRRADWMVIGEAPGEQEDREGAPFVGRSGQLLDRMLAAIGASREGAPADATEPGRPEGVYIANAVKCRPPGNRNPTPEEVQRCRPYLAAQIERVQPRLLLLAGRFAVQSVLGRDDPIGRLRGQVHEAFGRPAIVTYHPAYLLRSPLEKAKAWDDLCRARALLARLRAGPPA